MILAFKEEDDERLVAEIANLLHEMTKGALQFGDYALASRIFSELRERQRPLLEHPNASGRGFAVLNRKMDVATQALLMNELQSKEPSRQHQAAQVLESMGEPAIPLYLEFLDRAELEGIEFRRGLPAEELESLPDPMRPAQDRNYRNWREFENLPNRLCSRLRAIFPARERDSRARRARAPRSRISESSRAR